MSKKNENELTLNTDKDFIIYERVELENMTVKGLRTLAKQCNINFKPSCAGID